MAIAMDKSSYGARHVDGGLVNEAVVYDASQYDNTQTTSLVGGTISYWSNPYKCSMCCLT